ncbi:MAG: PAS domain-containing sensor histidine kinase [Patescibacteria group bacterium]
MNKVLERQIKKVFGSVDNVPKDFLPLIELISTTYDHSEEDRLLVERSFDLNSKEMSELNEKLKVETASLETRTKEAEDTKHAVLNLLEDIEEEKKKVDQLVILRTKELDDEKARLLASINSLSFGFIIAGIDHTILLNNRSAVELFGFKENEHITFQAMSAKFGEKFDIAAEAERCVKSGKVCNFKEILFEKKVLRGIISPIIQKQGTELVIGYVLLLEDVTEARALERSRDEFFSIASHELRTPLTAIRGNADMILDMYADKLVDKDMKEMLVDINTSSVRLIDIVNDFLEVSRLEQGRFELKKECFDIREVVDKVVRDLKSMTEQNGVALLYIPPGTPQPPVCADKNRVEQVLVNLVGNSAKFTKAGSITIHTEIIGRFLKLQVIDTGIGISEQNQNLLFRKFQQAGESTLARDVTQGTGLGLYICLLLISGMGGTIGVEKSELGKGSTFAFSLPLFE